MKNIILSTLIVLAAFLFGSTIYGQISGGDPSPKKGDTSNALDSNLRSVARINPTSLAMEFSLPLPNYPGRGGNGLSVGINYSSKVWQMKSAQTWWYQIASGYKRYVTDNYAQFGETSASGWTSTLQPPRLDVKLETYNLYGQPYGDSLDLGVFGDEFLTANQAMTSANPILAPVPWMYCSRTGHFGFCDSWMHMRKMDGTFNDEDPTVQTPTPNYIYYVKRLNVVMPDGTSREFMQNNSVIYCGTIQTGCTPNLDGTYLATDGTGLRLEYDHDGQSILHQPDGGKYTFPAEAQSVNGHFAEDYVDVNGNKTSFMESYSATTGKFLQNTVDTMGRTINEPIPHNWMTQTQLPGIDEIELPGLGTLSQDYAIKWESLKPAGCETSTSESCVGQNSVTGGALEDQTQKLFYDSRYFCKGNLKDDLLANPSNYSDPTNEVLFPIAESGIRPCNSHGVERDENGDPVLDQSGNSIIIPVRFNPVVLSEVTLPNGQKYIFKYNRFGEISKIIYPTGSYEAFTYASIDPLSNTSTTHNQMNRGVVERRVYDASDNLQQRWTYQAERTWTYPSTEYKLTTIASTGSNALGTGAKTVRYVKSGSTDTKFGFADPLVGMPYDERAYDENGVLRSRVLTEYTTKDESTWDFTAKRDLRPKRTLSIAFEGTQALATLSETDYDENGSSNPEHFSHLNPIRQKGYHYVSLTGSSVDDESLGWSTISGWFSGKLASVSETDYAYDSGYKARGITSLPIRTLALDPANPDRDHILAKSETIYDNTLPNSNSGYTYSLATYSGVGTSFDCSSNSTPEICWQNPNGINGTIDLSYRGLPTTSRVWVKETNTWIETHTQYDQFGNAVKAKDPIGNEASTVFSADYQYAYPTSVTTPPPDPTNTTGTNEPSTVYTSYDFNTGLPLSVTDDFGQVSTTEYNDPLLRPTRVNPVVGNGNPTGPVSETIYGAPDSNGQLPESQRFVKVRKQLDSTNWDEATTWFDSLGRTVKTVAKDSQGDVIVETHYDLLGRIDRVTNPYRQGDTVYWSKTRYDVAGRAVETYAPETLSNLSNAVSLGVTSFGISNVTDHVGTVVTTTDASGRKSRSITNALGQLTRVDEPTGISASADADLGALATPTQATTYKYDAFGKMVEVTQGVQKRWFKYDALGRLLRVHQPEQEVNTSLNLADAYNTSGQWTAAFAYDLLGNVVRATDANGVNIINDYDGAGRVIRRCYTKPNVNTSATSCIGVAGNDVSTDTPYVLYFYDGKGLALEQTPHNFAKGKLTKITSSVSETRNELFDNFGRVTQSAQITDGNTYTSKYTYNLSGALVEEEYPSGRRVKNEFEADGDLANVTSRKTANSVYAPYVSNFSYTASGGISQMKLGNGRWETAKFNTRMQVTELGLGHSATDAATWKTNYEYGELDANGNTVAAKNTGNIAKQILTVPGTSFTQAYKYDPLYRITEAKEATGATTNWIQNWGYDRYGNRTGFSQNIAGNTAATNPAIDQNTNRFSNLTDFGYDKNGNITRDLTANNQLRTFVFNADNKQTEVKDASGATVGQYFYDGEGKRVKKYIPTTGETTIFVYSSGKLVAEYSTVVAPASVAKVAYTTTDHLGSPRVITDAIGQVVSRRDFMPFGEDLNVGVGSRTGDPGLKYSMPGDTVRQKFTGYQKDNETQLDFAEARMYENRFGRFTAVDPLFASGRSINPQTFNRYVYVGNNPVILTDPMGLDWFKKGNEHVWSNDNKTLVTGEKIDETWAHVKDMIYWAGEDIGFVVLDPLQNDWSTGFETREDALHFLDPGQNVSLYEGVDEMMTVFDAVTIVGGLARRGAKKVVEEGAEFILERAIKKTTSQILRETAERELIAAGKKVTTQALNKLQGRLAEEFVEKQLIKEGYEILGNQVTARLANGDWRFIDRLVKSPSGDILGYEIKSGGSVYTKGQQAKDELINLNGAVLGNNAPATLQGQTMKFRMMLRHVE